MTIVKVSSVNKTAHRAIFLVCFVATLSLSSYGIVAAVRGHTDIVGATFVNSGIPFSLLFGLDVQPINILVAAALGMTYSGYELARPYASRLSKVHFSFIKLFVFVVIAMSGYEAMYNFAIWTAQISTNSLLGSLNPDILVNQFPNPKTPWNLVFATELFITIFIIAVYTFYYVRQLEKRLEHEQDEEKAKASLQDLTLDPQAEQNAAPGAFVTPH